jgi:hypothetical protein
LSARALASITIGLDPSIRRQGQSGSRVERLEQNVEAFEQDRDDGLLVEDRHDKGTGRRHGFRDLLGAKAQTLAGKGLNKGFARTGSVEPLLRQRFV